MNYDDIINLPHHVSSHHKQMSMLNRAAQFAPFAALSGHEEAIEETARHTDAKQELAIDSMAGLDQKLCLLQHRLDENESAEATITFFTRDAHKDGGSYQTVSGKVKSINEYLRSIVLNNGTQIPISDIVDLAV
jgi:hypothetical protein